jgi:hypothetical protein
MTSHPGSQCFSGIIFLNLITTVMNLNRENYFFLFFVLQIKEYRASVNFSRILIPLKTKKTKLSELSPRARVEIVPRLLRNGKRVWTVYPIYRKQEVALTYIYYYALVHLFRPLRVKWLSKVPVTCPLRDQTAWNACKHAVTGTTDCNATSYAITTQLARNYKKLQDCKIV